MVRDKRRILVCDDNPDILELVEMVLKGEGYFVIPVTSGREVVNRVRNEPVDLILLDLRMPDMDGLAVLEDLGGAGIPLPPVVVLSAKGLGEDRQAAVRAGASEYLMKPFRVEDLLGIVERCLAGP